MTIEKINKLLQNKYKDTLKTCADIPTGPAYILESGLFLYYDTNKFAFHGMEKEDVLKYISKKEFLSLKSSDIWPFVNEDNVLSINDGKYRAEECIVRLCKNRPNDKQFESLTDWIDNLIVTKPHIKYLQVTDKKGLSNYKFYNLQECSAKYIISRIKLYYISNKLIP